MPSELLDSSTMCQGAHHQTLEVNKPDMNHPYCKKCSECSALYKGLLTTRVPVVPLVISEI